MRIKQALLAGLLGFALTGCEEAPNLLEGSIDQNFDLTFDTTTFRLINGNTFQLDYLLTFEDGSQDVICKIVFDRPGDGIATDDEVDILANNGIVERIAGDGQFPPVESGIMRFELVDEDATPTALDGEFAITFEDGKTLNGNFETELEEVEL